MTMYRLISEENRMALFHSIKFAEHHYETDLEVWLENNLHVLTDGEPLLPIGRQLNTPISGTLDLLALDADGNVVVIELKREKPPRDAIAQALEYAAWAATQSRETIIDQANRYLRPHTLSQRWAETFSSQDEDPLVYELPEHIQVNVRQRIFLVVEGYSERITTVAQYLRKTGIDFNLVTFHYYRIDSGEEMLDFEISVGPDQERVVASKDEGHAEISEEGTVTKWSPSIQNAYRVFRRQLLGAEEDSLRIEPKKAAVSFRKQVADKKMPVYVCSFEPDRGNGAICTLGIRKPSLKDFLDVEAVVRDIDNDLPIGVKLSNQAKWATIYFEPQPDLAIRVADIIHRHVIRALIDN